MLTKKIQVHVDGATWPNGSAPSAFLPTGTHQYDLDVSKALLLLGNLTTPNGLSPASPSRFWAYVRYLTAIHTTRDLRITSHFGDLDPHQKTILSDDFGVALSTQWLNDRVRGFIQIVDGRLFISQFAHLTNAPPISTPKIGPGKSPDFVFLDSSGKWHVLECKGTQGGRSVRDGFLGESRPDATAACAQKQVIDVVAGYRGERLAAGLALSGPRSRHLTELRIVDPEVKPLVTITGDTLPFAKKAAQRLSLSRMIASAGFQSLATEMALPEEVGPAGKLLYTSERQFLRRAKSGRYREAIDEAKRTRLSDFERDGRTYMGRYARFDMPEVKDEHGRSFSAVYVRQGMIKDFVEEIREIKDEVVERTEEIGYKYSPAEGIDLRSEGPVTKLRIGEIYYSEMKFHYE